MKEYTLKYGCNPNQSPAYIRMADGGDLPFAVLNGRPGYINYLDALNAWQLVKALKKATGLAAAASFKHVSPAGAAVGLPLSETLKKIYFVEDIVGLDESPLACAYARARGADRLCSFGDFIALSDVCDVPTAQMIAREVSDGVIAPGYQEEALAILKQKRKGGYAVLQMDPEYEPKHEENRDVYGITLTQGYNDGIIDESLLGHVVTKKQTLPEGAKRDLLLAMITLKYTQSNSVCFVKDGQVIGNGAGQQSRVHCVRLAGDKADLWHLRQHPKALSLPFAADIRRPERDNAVDAFLSPDAETLLQDGRWEHLFTHQPDFLTSQEREDWQKQLQGVALGSDAFFPFSDNIDRANLSGVAYIAQPGGSVRDADVIQACDNYGMVMALTNVRLFHH